MTLFMDILNNFGVQPVLLVAQIVNFLVLLFLLKKFMYGPLVKVLQQRKQTIAESLKNAEEIEKRLEQTTLEQEKRLEKAAKEARQIVDDATSNADQIIAAAHEKARADTEKFMVQAQQSVTQEREKVYSDMRAELSHLVILGFEKIAGKALSEKDQKELVEKSLKELK